MVESSLLARPVDKDVGLVDCASTKSLEDFQQSVRIPKVNGVVSDVADLLNRQMGVGSLDIETIATALNLSKRTLQRHLQKHGSNFLTLRDKVRFKHAMICLLEKKMSIEDTANYLNFSDRTSFTNAFKHWSGCSPSTFRKAYRDML